MIDLSIRKSLESNVGKFSITAAITLAKGTLTAVQGRSGAGKTSLLRLMSGLITPDQGRISCNGVDWFNSEKQINLSVQKRNIGYVSQDYSLFPNMTVLGNLEFALPKGESKAYLNELIEIMALGDLQNVKPKFLSGGQQQRVALARALAQRPALLLLDEPLSALDPETRRNLQSHILALHQTYNLTTLMVTHDTAETLKLADHVLVMENGAIIKSGKPTEILANQGLSGKFQFTGEIVDIRPEGVVSIVSVLIGKDLVRVISEKEELKDLTIGDKVLVASKAFNPILKRLD
ncbi:ATP-binding cassette domain-containing protein [Roseivirga misakiensis]|uniref:GTPase n=1 Tax=Roseivirga misakiensis TaxID=1563681 RepID=A0A1E5T067_9BACT|nr:ATP-binding cassette domain-containing protein [Roseivirga misakiensis]OEK04778.1 GTPase [Roseivirga misakiensis]